MSATPLTPAQFAAAQGLVPVTPAPTTPPPSFILYQTTVGARWDLIAWWYYGDPTNFGPIVAANPSIPVEAVLEEGLSILVPILEESDILSDSNLPPWKRSNVAS